MKTTAKAFILCFLAGLLLTGCGTGTDDYNWSGNWALVWSDEFNGTSLDTAKWTAMDRGSSYNNELQAYFSRNVAVQGGYLILTSLKEDWTGPDNFNPGNNVTRHYTSGLADTNNKAVWKYGRFEICARLPATQGMWPAHWMLPDNEDWPPEIDIMELLGNAAHTVYCTNHWGIYPDVHSNGSGPLTGSTDYSAAFHVFTVEWEPGILRWYIDGNKVFESTQGVPSEPFYIILNTAVGGDWPGSPDGTTVFPQYHRIDWVRVYQRQ